MSRVKLTRRQGIKLAGLGLGTALLPGPVRALAQAGAGPQPRHGLSAFLDLRYPPDFAAFDYVDPDAPKGGEISLIGSTWIYNQDTTTFNTLNSYVLGGEAALGMELTFDSLMAPALDEPDSYYALVAESVILSDDLRQARFLLDPRARFHDGSPITAEDVRFSLITLKEEGHPLIRTSLAALERVEALDGEVAITIRSAFPVPTLLSVVGLPIFSQAYYRERDFTAATLEPPLGSGPYRVAQVNAGSSITYARVEDYWARDLPVRRGQFNFDRIRYEFYRDRDAAFTAFTAGSYDLREEFTAKTWATRYDFPAVQQGRVRTETLPDESPSGGQAWHLNTRRAKFADARVRQAIGLAFDFEWANENLFHGLYTRTHSFFENSPMKAEGTPSPAELALLEPLRGDVPAEVFGEAYVPPVTDGSGRNRRQLREAARLLDEAGVRNVGGRRQLPDGEPLEIEFLIYDNGFVRVIEPFAANLARIGIAARPRLVDAAQYQNRLNSFEFDAITMRVAVPLYPAPVLNSYFHSTAADSPGSRNYAGIRSPAVDQLLLHMLRAESREAYFTAARALDRVLRASHYMIPQWYKDVHTIAYWDRFSRPETKPRYARGIVETWWYDAEKAARL